MDLVRLAGSLRQLTDWEAPSFPDSLNRRTGKAHKQLVPFPLRNPRFYKDLAQRLKQLLRLFRIDPDFIVKFLMCRKLARPGRGVAEPFCKTLAEDTFFSKREFFQDFSFPADLKGNCDHCSFSPQPFVQDSLLRGRLTAGIKKNTPATEEEKKSPVLMHEKANQKKPAYHPFRFNPPVHPELQAGKSGGLGSRRLPPTVKSLEQCIAVEGQLIKTFSQAFIFDQW